ncbi:MAG: hypothetical protein JXB15_14475 [Anaerolineales bacterium]|nr:hypothetical protein [Anaerolineales bacterium]
MQRIIATWWPLAASWLLMSAEMPALSAVVARLADPEIHLAAYGGVVFPLALIIESPIIMLLSASTALSKDWASYQKGRQYMMSAGALLTILHILIAFTPLYDILVRQILGAPAEIIEPARIGLKIMLPWTWSIAYRRYNQGVLIRFGRSRAIGLGTLIRLSANGLVLISGYLLRDIPGIVVASSAVACGVVCEAVFVGIVARPVLAGPLKMAPAVQPPLTWRAFWAFYIPLAMTSLLTLLANPIGSAALSRMPDALASLAVWPVVTGLVFMLRSMGIAFNEVVVALLDEPGSYKNLLRFTWILASITSAGLLVIAATPLSRIWFGQISGLQPDLVALAEQSLWLAVPLPWINVFQSWYQGAILNSRRTRGITESVVVYLLTSALILGGGVLWGRITGVFFGLAALTLSMVTQTAWLGMRARGVIAEVRRRDYGQQASLELVHKTKD